MSQHGAGTVGAYEVRTLRVRGGVHVWVLSLHTGACLWFQRLRWPLSSEGKAELDDVERHVPNIKPWQLERELRRQMR